MKFENLKVYNGENRDITIVTDAGEFFIPTGKVREVKVAGDAIFNSGEFYIEEKGNWYVKNENCYTGADLEIYDAD